MNKRELGNALIEAIGPDFAVLLDDVNKQAETIARRHIAELCDKHGIKLSHEETESAVSGALAGLLVGPAVGHALNAGADVEQYIELVRTLFDDARAERDQN